MQQATSPIANQPTTAGNVFAPPPASPRFVVNLCSSTTPVGLVQPSHAGLKRFTFFVSRRLEEGRERFRLHMGYFESQEEAEKMLDLVRDVYPAAWASVAPGIKLRARAAQAAASAPPAPVAVVPVAAAPVVAAPVVAAPVVAAPVVVAPAAVAPPPVVAPIPAAAAAQPGAPAAPVVAAAVAAEPVATATAPAGARTGGVRLELAPDLPRASPSEEPRSMPASGDVTRSLVDVRAAINSLGDAEPASPGAVLEGQAVLQLLTSARPAPAARVAAVPPVVQARKPEREAAPPKPRPATAPRSHESSPRKSASPAPQAAAKSEPALFAVQLLWSVQPIDMGQVPLLAIFSAYTLYGAEGNRDGRRWYGLRLGFFTDAVSAKQVAQYVRSEFTAVSVVPVSERERGRASAATAKPLPQHAQRAAADPELKFIDEVPTDTAESGSQPALAAAPAPDPAQAPDPAAEVRPTPTPSDLAAMAAVGLTPKAAPGKRAKLRVAQGTKPVSKRPRPLSLEETLEILGAGDLSLEKSKGELMNDKAQRDRKQSAPANSKFGRLISRLTERFGNS